MAASTATEINIDLCKHLFYITVHKFSMNFSIRGSSTWSRVRVTALDIQSAKSDGHVGGQHDVSENTLLGGAIITQNWRDHTLRSV